MKVAYFYVTKYDQSVAALPPYAEHVCTGDDDYHYYRELKNRWALDDLVIIEQDKGNLPWSAPDLCSLSS